jgi:predicted nucleotidyltransferase
VFGSVARGEPAPDSDLDLLVDMGDGAGLFKQAALQGALEDLPGLPGASDGHHGAETRLPRRPPAD